MPVVIECGDVGVVTGRQGLFIVAGGVPWTSNMFPVNAAARAAARDACEPSEVIRLSDGSYCWKGEFKPWAQMTDKERERALKGPSNAM